MKLPFVNKLSAVTGVFARLNPLSLIAKIKARKNAATAQDDEDDARINEDNLFADLGDLNQLDAEARAIADKEGGGHRSDGDFDDFDNTELREFDEHALSGEHDAHDDDAIQTFDDEDALEKSSASSPGSHDIDLADFKVGGGFDDDDDASDDDEDEAAQKAKLKKLLIMAGGGVALAVVLGGVSWWLLGSPSAQAPGENVAAHANPEAEIPGGNPGGNMVINLDEVPAYVDHGPQPIEPNPSGFPSANSAASPKPAAQLESVAPTPQSNDGVPVSSDEPPQEQSELAQLGLDFQVEPGVGIVIPSATKVSYGTLKPWPAVEPLEEAPLAPLVEQGEHGLLPKISAEGETPFEAYARPAPTQKSGDPKIALIVTGLGMSRAGTEAAIAALPADVALSMDVYARGLDFWVKSARKAGHEVLLEMPSESLDFPFSDPGPNALKSLVSPEENLKQLEWILSRTSGYFGVLSVFGSKFLTVEEQVKAVVEALKKRGLMYVDGGVEDSLGTRVAYQGGAKWATVELTLDTVPGRAALDLQLQAFEALAKKRAVSIARVSANPMALEKLTLWLKTLSEKGLVLVPVSSLANKQLIR